MGTPTLLGALDILAAQFHGLRGMIGGLEDVADDQVPLGEIYEIAANYNGSLPEFVATIDRALSVGRATDAGNNDDGVALKTYFRAKGLQWHTVVLMSCNDGLIPHARGNLEEERRLFYVGMTRAQANLFVSYVRNVCRGATRPSRFLQEAGIG
jgi:DNA helicase-2/ATP-dependent DNA helicase PcrA